MTQMELPARKTVEAFKGLANMTKVTGRPKSTIFSRMNSDAGRFPHWWTRDLQEIAQREGVVLPEPKPRKAKRRRAA